MLQRTDEREESLVSLRSLGRSQPNNTKFPNFPKFTNLPNLPNKKSQTYKITNY